jgi:hypothetical protein
MRPLPGERLLKDSRLAFFNARLKERTFNSPSWSTVTVEDEEGEWRADGQHTSTALAGCDVSVFPEDMGVTINRYSMSSMEEAPVLFDLFDNPRSARSNTDKIGVDVAGYEELVNISRSFLFKVANGIDFYRRDLPETDKNQVVHKFGSRAHGSYFHESLNREFAVWLDAISSLHQDNERKPARHAWMVGKPGLVAEIFADWSTNPEIALRFWDEVLNESNPDPNDDTRELSSKLKDWTQKKIYRQEHFRREAKKIWSRYYRMSSSKAA